MAKKYKEKNVSGTEWLRYVSFTIQNPYNLPPSVVIAEEKILEVPGAPPLTESSTMLNGLLDPENVIEIIDVDTGLPSGETITEAYLYQAIYSKYIQMAQERDDAAAVVLQIGEED